MFTSIIFEGPERDKYFDQIPESPEKYNVHMTDNYKVAGFKLNQIPQKGDLGGWILPEINKIDFGLNKLYI